MIPWSSPPPPHILDKDAFERILSVEGPEYKEHYDRGHFDGEWSFFSIRKKYQELFWSGTKEPFSFAYEGTGCLNSIYGLGGWNRYFVDQRGYLWFSYAHRAVPVCLLRREGFYIFPTDCHMTPQERKNFLEKIFTEEEISLLKKEYEKEQENLEFLIKRKRNQDLFEKRRKKFVSALRHLHKRREKSGI